MNIFWFRRDLRLDDNVGLFHALNANEEVLPIFIFDETILSFTISLKKSRNNFKRLENH